MTNIQLEARACDALIGCREIKLDLERKGQDQHLIINHLILAKAGDKVSSV